MQMTTKAARKLTVWEGPAGSTCNNDFDHSSQNLQLSLYFHPPSVYEVMDSLCRKLFQPSHYNELWTEVQTKIITIGHLPSRASSKRWGPNHKLKSIKQTDCMYLMIWVSNCSMRGTNILSCTAVHLESSPSLPLAGMSVGFRLRYAEPVYTCNINAAHKHYSRTSIKHAAFVRHKCPQQKQSPKWML